MRLIGATPKLPVSPTTPAFIPSDRTNAVARLLAVFNKFPVHLVAMSLHI